MSGYTKFAVVGFGTIGSFIIQQLLKDKAAGTIKEVVLLTRQSSKTVQGGVKVIQVDYSSDESIKNALAGVDVVISAIANAAIDVQEKIAAAAKQAGVKLFVPSEYGGASEEETEDGMFAAKAKIQTQLKAVGIPYAAFYTGPFADCAWVPLINLDVLSGKVSVGGDGNKQVSFTARPDVVRYMSYILTHLPAEQLKNRSFTIAGDNVSFNELFKAYEEKTGKKLEVTYVPVSELDAKLAANPEDLASYFHGIWATLGPFKRTDNHLYPAWNPSPVIDYLPVA